MVTLVPRRLAEIAEWFDEGLRPGDSHVIRVEDSISDNDYQLRAELPGMDPEKDMQISVDDGMLNIHAERRHEKRGDGHTEFAYGSFDRSVRLPRNADSEHIGARYDGGVLTVTVPLTTAEPTGKQIPISMGTEPGGGRTAKKEIRK